MDHLRAMHQLIEKCAEYNISLCLAYVNNCKPFDLVEIPAVLEVIQHNGVDPMNINILKHIYQNTTSFIILHKVSEPFKQEKEVRQADCISPKLFTACLEQIFRKLNWEEMGIKIDGEMFNNLRLADDIVLASENPKELQAMLEQQMLKAKLLAEKLIYQRPRSCSTTYSRERPEYHNQ